MKTATIQLLGQTLVLHPFKAIFWEEKQALLLADLHLGKAAHFRKEGIPVPANVQQQNWDKLLSLLVDFKPKRVLFLGDLFHSTYNAIWEEFVQLLEQFEHINFELVKGNHDILPDADYAKSRLLLHEEPYEAAPFLLSHHPMEVVPAGCYNLAGHIHPAVFLKSGRRLRVKLPCFHFGESQAILPAFGAFTGTAIVESKRQDKVFVITDNEVLGV